MARLDAKWYNFWGNGQTWYHFWQDAKTSGSGTAYVSELSDSVTAADSAVKTVSLVKVDATTGSDTSSKNLVLSKSDSQSVVDSESSAVSKQSTDTITATDSYGNSFVSVKSDSISIADDQQKSSTKNISEITEPTDDLGKTITLSISDSIQSTDNLGESEQNVIELSDTIDVTDEFDYTIIKPTSDNNDGSSNYKNYLYEDNLLKEKRKKDLLMKQDDEVLACVEAFLKTII